ncbi:MAG: DinB family protein [Chitinophagaceae bacterium]|nr:DinB family protein [Chitinophagaceae bacterium]
MTGISSKKDILQQTEKISRELSTLCSGIPSEIFFRQPTEKWSVAQNITHLITSANMTRLAYRLPKFLIRIYTGKPNRPSRTYDELVARYTHKLEQGGRASGRFVAKPVSENEGTEKIMNAFSKAMEKLISTIQKNWEDPQLDRYLAPHPLLGKITLRELGFFTIYHTEHHLHIIRERLSTDITD